MSFPRYPAYKDSGLSFLGTIPKHWDVTRLKFVARVQTGVAKGKDNTQKDTITVPYLRVANVQDGYFDLEDVAHIEIPSADLRRYALQAGDVLMNEGGDYDKLGRGHIWDGCINPCVHQNHVFAVRPHGVSSTWLNRVTGSAYAQFYFMSRSKQSTNLASISSTNVMELPVVKPPASEQVAIDAFLERETARIDALVKEQEQLVTLLDEEVEALVLSAFEAASTRAMLFGHAVDVMDRPVTQNESESYRPLGLYNKGRGLFHKDQRSMVEMGDSDFFWIEPGDLIISGQFAWEGSVAMAGESERGCVVSHRYPVLRGRTGVALTEYIFALLCTRHGDFLLNECSLGAAGRNRPLNLGLLLKEKIPVPNLDAQYRIAKAVHNTKQLAEEVAAQRKYLQEHRSALISAAVTGQIDVRQLTQ